MANETLRDPWRESGVGWVENEQIFDAVMAPFTNALLNNTALGATERIVDVLSAAGWQDIVVEPFDGLCDYSVNGSDGVEERLAIIEASTTGRARHWPRSSANAAGWI